MEVSIRGHNGRAIRGYLRWQRERLEHANRCIRLGYALDDPDEQAIWYGRGVCLRSLVGEALQRVKRSLDR